MQPQERHLRARDRLQPRDRLTGHPGSVSIAPPSSAGRETSAPGEGFRIIVLRKCDRHRRAETRNPALGSAARRAPVCPAPSRMRHDYSCRNGYAAHPVNSSATLASDYLANFGRRRNDRTCARTIIRNPRRGHSSRVPPKTAALC